MLVGYKRVSTIEQNTDRQLSSIDVERMFIDKVSGKDIKNRPALLELLDFVREGDSVFFHSFDRASRSLKDLLEIIERLTSKGVVVNFVKENLAFNGVDDSPMAKLQLHIMASVYAFEREIINDRIREGVHLAKQAGKYKGRKPTLSNEEKESLLAKHKEGVKICQLSRDYNISRPTVYKYIREQ